MDLSSFLSCQAILKFHILRANRVAYLIKRSSIAQVEEPPLSDCGWDHKGRIIWIEEVYPSAVERLLVDRYNANKSDEEDVDEYFGEDSMSDNND